MFRSLLSRLPSWKLSTTLLLFLPLSLSGCNLNYNSAYTANIDLNQLVILKGAGATLPSPLYQLWIKEYTKDRANIKIAYDAVGSGAGVENFLEQNVDFGATDAPLKPLERQAFPADRGNPIQIPMTGGLVVFAYNLSNFEGSDRLKLSRSTYCAIVTGQITQWNDPQIAADNPKVRFPNLPIIFIHRADSSGTTFIFTHHLQNACPNWQAGAAKKVAWPTGIDAPGNDGVSAQIQQTQGAIGYTEYSHAKDNDLQMAIIQNKRGKFINPSPKSAAQAFVETTIPEDFALLIPDPDNPNAYPLVGLTWLLVYGNYSDPAKPKAIKDFIQWSLTRGDRSASELGYIPIPDDLEKKVISTLNQNI
jgi:phosphate transport system substrate-binding protein